VRVMGEVVTAVARWIGQVTRLANDFPDPTWTGNGKQRKLRDSQGHACLTRSLRRPAQGTAVTEQPSTVADSVAPCLPSASRRRRRANSVGAPSSRRAPMLKRLRAEYESRLEANFMQHWQQSLVLQPSSCALQPSPAERREAVRARVVAKARL
jgi:hypothetical protein